MKIKKIISIILQIATIVLVILNLTTLIKDYFGVYQFGSAPFYLYILSRGFQFLFPAIVCVILIRYITKR